VRLNETEVLVASGQKDLLLERMRLIAELWAGGVRAEQVEKANPQLLKCIQHAESTGIPYVVIIGTDEIERGIVKVPFFLAAFRLCAFEVGWSAWSISSSISV
jgi:histidyl-tRNA synthetase